MPGGDALHDSDQMIYLRLTAVQLHDQQRLSFQRVAGMDKGLCRLHRQAVHHFHTARNDAGADDRSDAVSGTLDAGKTDQQRAGARRLGQDPHRHLRYHAKQALRAHHYAHQVVTRAVEILI